MEGTEGTAEPKKGSGTSQPGTGGLEWPVKERDEIRSNFHVPSAGSRGTVIFFAVPVDDIFPLLTKIYFNKVQEKKN